MKVPWKSHGSPMIALRGSNVGTWKYDRRPTEIRWEHHRSTMGSPKSYESLLKVAWKPHMGKPRENHGSSMGLPWKSHLNFMGIPQQHRGQTMEPPRTVAPLKSRGNTTKEPWEVGSLIEAPRKFHENSEGPPKSHESPMEAQCISHGNTAEAAWG